MTEDLIGAGGGVITSLTSTVSAHLCLYMSERYSGRSEVLLRTSGSQRQWHRGAREGPVLGASGVGTEGTGFVPSPYPPNYILTSDRGCLPGSALGLGRWSL